MIPDCGTFHVCTGKADQILCMRVGFSFMCGRVTLFKLAETFLRHRTRLLFGLTLQGKSKVLKTPVGKDRRRLKLFLIGF